MVVALTVSALAATAAEKSVKTEWHSDYGKALAETKKVSRPLFIVLEEPEQTANVKQVSTSESKEHADYVLCRVDVTTDYGKKVAAAFKTTSFPYIAVIDKSGKTILHSESGEMSEKSITSTLAKYSRTETQSRTVSSSTTNYQYNWVQPGTQVYCPT